VPEGSIASARKEREIPRKGDLLFEVGNGSASQDAMTPSASRIEMAAGRKIAPPAGESKRVAETS
jgi:hypothetical protein